MMKPRDAVLNRHIVRLQTDNHDTVEGWILIDGSRIVLQNQKHSEPSTGKVEFTRRSFNRLIDWYNRDQKLRRK